jgi:hypothetical protein
MCVLSRAARTNQTGGEASSEVHLSCVACANDVPVREGKKTFSRKGAKGAKEELMERGSGLRLCAFARNSFS